MRAFLADSFQRFDLSELTAAHFVDNPASGRVLTKLAFKRTGAGVRASAGRLEDAAEYLYRLTRDHFGTDT
jgi:RimJ/RimL family protein N-acetyltransferase